MANNIEYNSYLLSQVMKVGRFRCKKDALNAALKEYLQRRQHGQIISLFGTIEYDKKHDYKKMRTRNKNGSLWTTQSKPKD
jgi:hypothetical protein